MSFEPYDPDELEIIVVDLPPPPEGILEYRKYLHARRRETRKLSICIAIVAPGCLLLIPLEFLYSMVGLLVWAAGLFSLIFLRSLERIKLPRHAVRVRMQPLTDGRIWSSKAEFISEIAGSLGLTVTAISIARIFGFYSNYTHAEFIFNFVTHLIVISALLHHAVQFIRSREVVIFVVDGVAHFLALKGEELYQASLANLNITAEAESPVAKYVGKMILKLSGPMFPKPYLLWIKTSSAKKFSVVLNRQLPIH